MSRSDHCRKHSNEREYVCDRGRVILERIVIAFLIRRNLDRGLKEVRELNMQIPEERVIRIRGQSTRALRQEWA